MSWILNLTQHAATEEQQAAGVVDVSGADREELVRLLTFDELPKAEEIAVRAATLAVHARQAGTPISMIGGAPYLMAPLEAALRTVGILPVYAFSRRESVEKVTPEGVIKTAVFKHCGFVSAE